MSDLRCRDARQALGIYVLGTMDPAERGPVEEHLSGCAECRAELAGLAGLPELLSRVPLADAERLAGGDPGIPPPAPPPEPPPELLRSLLDRVAARRRARRWRGLAAAAAAVAIAVGGGVLSSALGGHRSAVPLEAASASSARTHVSALVDYAPSGSGTAMHVQVSGIAPGTVCRFWVLNSAGQRVASGGWTVLPSYGRGHYYPAAAPVPPASVHGFQITAGRSVLLTIPAT